MRRIAIICALTAAMLLSACSDGDDDGVISIDEGDLTAEATVVTRTATAGEPTPQSGATQSAATQEPTGDGEGDSVEVQGIIGAIDHDAGVITINRLQGADVDRVEVGEGTDIRSARGGAISLADLRVSDRIIATGEVEDGALVATRIEISQVVPGADPGG